MTQPVTIGDCVAAGARQLAAAGIVDARREARLILAHALGVDTVEITGYPERPVPDSATFETLIARRAGREPLSHLTGQREFWSMVFETGPDTLDPRPDSETLIEVAVGCVADRTAPLSVLDLGTGTGCLLLAALCELPRAAGLGIDKSPAAVAVARRNADRLGLAARVRFGVGNWGQSLDGPFDLILCNPPYVKTGEFERLEPEVTRFEPRAALDGGVDGLDAYRALIPDIARLLSPRGAAVLEFGAGQGDRVAQIVAGQGFSITGVFKDLAQRDRCMAVRKP